MSHRASRVLIAALCWVLGHATAHAQDGHYWTNQFGNRARLLGGAVVGGVRDASAVIYNPGALALVEDPELLLAGNVFQVTRIAVDDVGPQDTGLGSTAIRLSPSLFAGEFRLGFLGNQRLAYSFLTRHDGRFRSGGRLGLSDEQLADDDLRMIGNDLRVDFDMAEYWAGVTWAGSLGDRIGFGVSHFFAVRNQRSRVQSFSQAVAGDGRAAVAFQARDFELQHWRMLWKIGLAGELGQWQLGATVTTPGVSLGGNGSSGLDRTVVGQDLDQDGVAVSDVTSGFRSGIRPEHDSPTSVAVGASYPFGATSLHISAEWFGTVSRFAALDAAPFASQTSGELFSIDVTRELESVVNVGVGLEHRFTDRVAGYGSFRTDRSGAVTGASATLPVTDWDLYHAAGGLSFPVGPSDMTLGAVAAFGSSQIQAPLSLEDATAGTSQGTVTARFLRLSFILGFDFGY
jgi:hypothetical protein